MPDEDNAPLSVADATAQLFAKRNPEPAPSEDEAPPVTPPPRRRANAIEPQNQPREEEPPAEEDAAPEDEDPPLSGEDDLPPEVLLDEDEDPADPEPVVDPPLSWTKPEREAFAKLPPQYQRAIADRDREIQRGVRQAQNEAAAIRKSAEEAAAKANEAARYYHEQALPAIQQEMMEYAAVQFADIKTAQDVANLRRTDPARYLEFEALARNMQAKQTQLLQFKQQQDEQAKADLEKFRNEEVKKFLELAPEYADAKRAPQLHAQVRELFNDVGIPDDEMKAIFGGDGKISVHDHRAQLIIRDAARWRAAQKRAKAAPKKPDPTVLRPGTASTRGERATGHIESLDKRLSRSGSKEDAVALLVARKRNNR